MPGGRLTQEDRRLIGSGLSDGLGYAEIARRLGRPTSTVSREVARNGGADRYRPDHAHHATGRRARRGVARPGAAAPADRDQDTVAVGRFVDEFAAMMTATGLPRMAARVLACLCTVDSGSLTAADLVRRLRVSPASVSKAVGYLAALDVIRRERAPGRRWERYVVDDGMWVRAWTTSTRSNARWAEAARDGAVAVGAGSAAGLRLERMARFFTELSDDMAGGATAEVFADAVAVTAALVQVREAATVERLAAGLDWDPDRVRGALRDASAHPTVTGAVTVEARTPTTWTAAPARLTPTQLAALAP